MYRNVGSRSRKNRLEAKRDMIKSDANLVREKLNRMDIRRGGRPEAYFGSSNTSILSDSTDSCCPPNPIGGVHIYATIRYLYEGNQSIQGVRTHYP